MSLMLWIPVTLAAATFQILRTARQHELRAVLSTSEAGFARYVYGAPMALVASALWFGVLARDLPDVPTRFWPTVVGAGVAQIVATIALLASFKRRDFAIGTVYSKAEVLIVAGLGALGLGQALASLGWLGAIMVTTGVMMLATRRASDSAARPTATIADAADPAALLGLLAGAGFALAAIGIGSAASGLEAAPSFDRALFTLTVMLTIQTLLNATWFGVMDPSALRRTAAAWRPAVWVGVLSLLGSLGWAWGFTLESAAKVRVLGQIELIIAFAIAHITLGERHTIREYLASALVLTGVVVVTIWG